MISQELPPAFTRVESVEFDPAHGGPLLALPEGHTVWDQEVVHVDPSGDGMTLQGLMAHFKDKYGVRTTCVRADSRSNATAGDFSLVLYGGARHADRLGLQVTEVFSQCSGTEISDNFLLRLDCLDAVGQDVLLPPVLYEFR